MAKAYYICLNPQCGEKTLGTDTEVKKFCRFCNSAEKRHEAEEENKKISVEFAQKRAKTIQKET